MSLKDLMVDPPLGRFWELLSRSAFPGYRFQVSKEGKAYFLNILCPQGRCNRTGEPAPWKGRKWRLSEHMTDGEVVSTAFKAIITALEHEARELFKFDGQPVFDSHIDIHKLVALHRDQTATTERSPL